MASISANGAKGHHKFTLNVTETGTSSANNSSYLSFSFVLTPIVTGWDWVLGSSVISYTVSINGTKYTGNIQSYDGSSTVTLKSGTQTVTHDSDGSKTISLSFSVTDGAGKTFTCGNASANGTMMLTTLSRGATLLTAPNFSNEDNPTITYSNPSGNSVTSLQACISLAGGTDNIELRDVPKTGTSYTFYLTEAERNVLINATTSSNSRTVYFYLVTVVDGEEYRDKLQRTFTVASGVSPIISTSVVDTNSFTVGLTGNNSTLIRYHSTARAIMTAVAQSGATIDSDQCVIRNGSNHEYGTVAEFTNVDSNVFSFSAVDSRGNVGTSTYEAVMVNYIKPTCNIASNKPDASGNMTVMCSGNYFNGSFGYQYNTITVQYRYKLYGSTSWQGWFNMSVSTSGNSYTATASLSGLDYLQTYTFETRIIDQLNTVTSSESAVKSLPVFHWGKNDFVFEVPVTFNSGVEGIKIGDENGNLNITGNLRLKGAGNYGNAIFFGDSSYCYLQETTDDNLTIKANEINLNANTVKIGGYPVFGSWLPTLYISAVSSYTTRDGWYQKLGNVVTVGWQIRANISSGYNSTQLEITGVPYIPITSAFGGGVAFNIYIGGGFVFEGWGIDTNGVITARLQPCNNTASGNLQISSTSYYPEGGGTVSLSGTICYMTN